MLPSNIVLLVLELNVLQYNKQSNLYKDKRQAFVAMLQYDVDMN